MADGIGAEPALRRAVRDMHWMARRYCDLRSSYAPGLFNGLLTQTATGLLIEPELCD